jgi:hypothetical protein
MVRTFAIAVTLAAATLPVLAGCGGSGDAAPTTTSLSRADYLARADAICARVDAKIRAIPAPRSVTQLIGIADKNLAYTEPAVRRLRALTAPADFAPQAREVVDGLAHQIALIRRLREAAASNDVHAIDEIGVEGKQASAKLGTAASAAGFKDCGIDTSR